jgi:GTP pyrophosphokinase
MKKQECIQKALDFIGEKSAYLKTGVASILLDLNMDSDTVIAATLTDKLKDQAEPEKISAVFGAQIAELVKNTLKISSLSATNKTIHEAENIRNMLFIMTEDIRVIIIKLAEMLNSLRMQDNDLAEKRKILARECLDIYAPLADRLGIFRIKVEMDP